MLSPEASKISPWSPHFRDILVAAGRRNAADGYGWIPTRPEWFAPVRIPIHNMPVSSVVAVTRITRGPLRRLRSLPLVADLQLGG